MTVENIYYELDPRKDTPEYDDEVYNPVGKSWVEREVYYKKHTFDPRSRYRRVHKDAMRLQRDAIAEREAAARCTAMAKHYEEALERLKRNLVPLAFRWPSADGARDVRHMTREHLEQCRLYCHGRTRLSVEHRDGFEAVVRELERRRG